MLPVPVHFHDHLLSSDQCECLYLSLRIETSLGDGEGFLAALEKVQVN